MKWDASPVIFYVIFLYMFLFFTVENLLNSN